MDATGRILEGVFARKDVGDSVNTATELEPDAADCSSYQTALVLEWESPAMDTSPV